MKLTKDPKWLPWSVRGLGCVGCALRFLLYRIAVDEKGLLVPMHPVGLILWVLAAAAVALAVLFTGNGPKKRRDDQLEALGQVMAAVGIAISAAGGFKAGTGILELVHSAFGLAAAVLLCFGAILRWQSKPEPIFCAGVACVFFTVHLITRYRGWSMHPQFQNYAFPVAATITAMFFSYLRCDGAKWKLRRMVGLVGTFCCLTAICRSADPALYLGAGLWMITNLHAQGEAA